MASQLDADIVSVMLLPLGKVALAAPAQQSKSIKTSDAERSSRVCIADHLNRGKYWKSNLSEQDVDTYCNHGDPECRVLQRSQSDYTTRSKDKGHDIRAPGALSRLVYFCVTSIINNKKSIFGLVFLDESPYLQHQIQVRIIGRDGEDFGAEAVCLTQTSLEILQLWQDKEVVRFPV